MYSSDDECGGDEMSSKRMRSMLKITPTTVKFAVGRVEPDDGMVRLKNGIYVSPLLYILFTNHNAKFSEDPYERLRESTLKMIDRELEMARGSNSDPEMIKKIEYAEFILERNKRSSPQSGRGHLMIF